VLATAILIPLKTGASPTALVLLYFALLRTLMTVLRMYVFTILIYAILSFVNPGTYNPLSSVLASISEPLLRPVRRVIPPIGGLDLSPLFVIIGLQALIMAIPLPGILR
jgi:YggT family protein